MALIQGTNGNQNVDNNFHRTCDFVAEKCTYYGLIISWWPLFQFQLFRNPACRNFDNFSQVEWNKCLLQTPFNP